MRLKVEFCLRAVVAFCIFSSSQAGRGQESYFEFAQPGVDFKHNASGNIEGYLPSLMASGIAIIDYDNNGLDDVFFCNGYDLTTNSKFANELHRNNGGWEFKRLQQASIGGKSLALGACSADFDNDGFRDLFVSTLGGVECLLNNGDGTFKHATDEIGLAVNDVVFGAGVLCIDFDRDGDLDLFVADYVDFSMKRFIDSKPSSFPYPPGPAAFPYRADVLYENLGDGRFRNASDCLSDTPICSPSMGAVVLDADRDGWPDILVCSDAMPNLLYINQKDGTFTEEAFLFGIATNASGNPVGHMGAAVHDVDGDGVEDVFITSYSGQNPISFKGIEDVGYQDVTLAWKANTGLFQHANWGADFVDFDNDGRIELFVANGHLFPGAGKIEQMTKFAVQDTMLTWRGTKFLSQPDVFTGLPIRSSRGCAVADFDKDGFQDLVIANSGARASMLWNTVGRRADPRRNWLRIRLIGTSRNRDACGAIVRVNSKGRTAMRRQRTGQGYQSGSGIGLHFGLGMEQEVASISVDWGGRIQLINNVPVNQEIVIIEEQ